MSEPSNNNNSIRRREILPARIGDTGLRYSQPSRYSAAERREIIAESQRILAEPREFPDRSKRESDSEYKNQQQPPRNRVIDNIPNRAERHRRWLAERERKAMQTREATEAIEAMEAERRQTDTWAAWDAGCDERKALCDFVAQLADEIDELRRENEDSRDELAELRAMQSASMTMKSNNGARRRGSGSATLTPLAIVIPIK